MARLCVRMTVWETLTASKRAELAALPLGVALGEPAVLMDAQFVYACFDDPRISAEDVADIARNLAPGQPAARKPRVIGSTLDEYAQAHGTRLRVDLPDLAPVGSGGGRP